MTIACGLDFGTSNSALALSHKVFLTGGSSYIPLLQNIFIQRLGLEKIKHADAFLSVAYGLGLSSGYMFS